MTVGLHVCGERTKTDTMQQISTIRAARTKGQKRILKKRFGVTDVENPILHLRTDPNQYVNILVKQL